MGIEAQAEYFVSRTEGIDGRTLSVFYAPLSDGLTVPKEVLRAGGLGDFASGSLWKLMSGDLTPREYEAPVIEPSSVEQISRSLNEFMKTQTAGGVIIDDEAPDEIKETLQLVEENLNTEAQTTLARLLGLDAPQATAEDDRPYPGQYL